MPNDNDSKLAAVALAAFLGFLAGGGLGGYIGDKSVGENREFMRTQTTIAGIIIGAIVGTIIIGGIAVYLVSD